MRKFTLFFMLFLGCIGSMQATFDFEIRAAYFIPQDSRIRDIYGKGFAEYELEASSTLDCWTDCLCDYEAFLNFGYFDRRGTSTCPLARDRTKVRNWALTIGLKRYFETCWCLRPYLGLGVGFARVEFHDHSDYVKNHLRRWGGALLFKSGVEYDITCNLYLDMFVDYAYHWYRSNNKHCPNTIRNVNTGGLLVGLGLGYKF